MRIFSTQTETFNKSLGRASYNRKASKKKGRTVDDTMIMPPMIDIAAEKTREKEWDNIAAAHLGLGVITTWSYDKLKMGEHKLLPEKFKFNLNVTATTVSMTQCGNFVLVGYNNGSAERFNIQSGSHRASYGGDKGAHEGPVKGISVDCLNTVVVTAGRDAKIKFWPFKPLKSKDLILFYLIMFSLESFPHKLLYYIIIYEKIKIFTYFIKFSYRYTTENGNRCGRTGRMDSNSQRKLFDCHRSSRF